MQVARIALPAICLLVPISTQAQVYNWGGTGSTTATTDYNLVANWSKPPVGAPPVTAGQSAIFDATGSGTVVVTAGPIAPDSWTFNATSQFYSISGAPVNFTLAGASGGIINNANFQIIAIANRIGESIAGVQVQQLGFSTLILFNANTYSGGTTISGFGTLVVNKNTSVGSGIVDLKAGFFQASGLSDLTVSNNFTLTDGALNANGVRLTIAGNISDGAGGAGHLTVVDSPVHGAVILTGTNTYSGGTMICFCGTLQLGDATHTASIVGAVTNEGVFDIVNANTAAITSINNNGGLTTFYNAASAASIAITNRNGGETDFGVAFGTDTATAGNAVIVNRSGGLTAFNAATSAGSATITNRFSGETDFWDQSKAGTATIVNRFNGVTTFNGSSSADNAGITNRLGGSTFFFEQSSAGNATITNGSSGNLIGFFPPIGLGFFDDSTAGTATIINNNHGFIAFGFPFSFDTASADHANITNNAGSSLEFNGLTTAGDATITTLSGAAVAFFDGSTGGNAKFITNGTGYVDFSGSIGPGFDGRITAGSIAGSGTYYIGAGNTLISGGNNLSTEVSGVIADFNPSPPCGCPAFPGPGALEKVGSGTMILSGTNSYTGGTTITAGALVLGNGGATGSILGDVIDNATLVFNRSNAYQFDGAISGSGVVVQYGSGTTTLTAANTYTGATTVAAGTLAISVTGSVTSNVTNFATFNNAGTVTGSVTNNGTASNSGTITNGLSNNAGTTTNTGTINGGLINSAIVNGNGGAINGAIVNNSSATFTVGGTVTSNSTFTNATGATLAVGTTGAYTLQGLLTNSGIITVASGGQLTATVGGVTNTAGGSITVALGGTVKDDLNNAGPVTNNGAYLAKVATNTGTIVNSATGVWTGNVLSNAAAITNSGTWAGNVVSNTGIITNNLTWTGTVSNTGTFTNNAGATVSGLLTNTAGVVTNDGALNGGAVINGGALIGIGIVGNTLIASGGIFRPGNGTPGSFMTVAGNLAFQSGALYLVQLNSVTSSFTNVTGTAALDGLVGASFLSGATVRKQYTILTAGGGHSGAYTGVETLGLPPGFVASLSYDPTHAYLNFALNYGPNLNVNQQGVGNALGNFFNSNGGISAIFGALTPAGLTQISGQLATGTQQATFDAMNLFLGLLTDPFIGGRDGGAFGGTGAAPFAEETAIAYAARKSSAARDAIAKFPTKADVARNNLFESRWSVWGAAYGGGSTTQGNAALGSNNATARAFGFAAGADYRISPATLAGFALAGGGTNFSVNGLGSGRSDLFQAGAFVRHNIGAAYVTGVLAYGWQDVTTDRTVTVAGIDRLRAEFNANAWSGRIEGGYRYLTPWMGVTPYAAGQFTTYSLPAYAEQVLSGANTFALNYNARDVTASRSEIGIRTDKSFAMQNAILTLRGRLAWAHDFNTDRNITPVFQTLPGASFIVSGAAQAHDSALTTASAEMKWLNGWSAAATFEGQFSDVTRSYAGKGVARYTW